MWDWGIFWEYLFHRGVLNAAAATLSAAVAGQLIGVALGLAIGGFSMSRSRALSLFADVYVRLFRGTPLLLQVLAFFIVPSEFGIRVPVFLAGVLALGMNEAAYLSEVVRSGLMSVPAGQREAAQVLGFGSVRTFRLVTLPQAARVILPPLGTAFNSMIKTTALLAFISYQELLRFANLTNDTIYRPFEIFVIITIYYLAMTTVWTMIQEVLERRFSLEPRSTRRLVSSAEV